MIGILINSLSIGGAERIAINFANDLNKIGLDPILITLEAQMEYDNPDSIKIVHLSKKKSFSSNVSKLAWLLFLAWQLKKITRKSSIDVVQSHLIRSNIVNVLSKLLGAKHKAIITNHNIVSHHLQTGFLGQIKIFIIKLFYSFADEIIFISKEMQYDFQKTIALKGSQHVIYNPHDLQNIVQKTTEEPDFNFSPEVKYIIYFGRLIKRKNVDTLIKTFAEIRAANSHVNLIVLGGGEELPHLKDLANHLGLGKDIHFIDSTNNPFKYVSRCHVSVLPSNREGLPNTIIESMICRSAVVAADCSSGPREILSPDSNPLNKLSKGYEVTDYGILFAVNDTEALKEAICILLNDDKLTRKLTENGHTRVQTFDHKLIIAQHVKLLNNCKL